MSDPSPSEVEYREHVRLAKLHLDEAHREHRPPAVRAESLAEAQVHATLALAAATLAAAEPRIEYHVGPTDIMGPADQP